MTPVSVAAVEQFHGVERTALVETVVEDLHDARVRQLREDVKLALEGQPRLSAQRIVFRNLKLLRVLW